MVCVHNWLLLAQWRLIGEGDYNPDRGICKLHFYFEVLLDIASVACRWIDGGVWRFGGFALWNGNGGERGRC
jgi:hypothetical protein